MTPLQFAREECANFENDGSCAGIGIKDNGKNYSFGKQAKCLLSIPSRCVYFEECVLPVHPNMETVKGCAFAAQLAEVRGLYSRLVPGFNKNKVRKCIGCKRREVEKHKRLCYECANKRKKASKLESQRRARHEEKTVHKTSANIG